VAVLHEEVDAVLFEGDGLDSRVRFFRVSKTSSGTAALGTMPWMVPVPSRKMGKRSLPEARRL
jgi:hypothetical protein